MFQRLYEHPHALKRHLTGPLLDERLRYLTHWAERGAAWTTLRSTASYLLVLIDQLKLSEIKKSPPAKLKPQLNGGHNIRQTCEV